MKIHLSKHISRLLIPAIATLVVIAAILLGVRTWDHHRQSVPLEQDSYLSDDSEQEVVYIDGKAYTPKQELETILFLGIDRHEENEAYTNNQQADVLQVMVIDRETQSYSILPIDRDTVTTFDMLNVMGEKTGDKTAQIALSHAYGSGDKDSVRNTVHAVNDLLYGVNIQSYISLQMDAVPILNDAVGGVEVELLDDFSMLDPSFIKGQTVTLHGNQALSYVQERGALEDSSNRSRMKRQEQYLQAWEETFTMARKNDDMLMANMITDVSDYLITDLTVAQLERLADELGTFRFDGFLSIEGESVVEDGYMAFYVDEEALQQQIVQVFYQPVV